MDDQLQLDRHLAEFFAEAKATCLTHDEREHCRFAIESHLIAQSVSLAAGGRLDGMTRGRGSPGMSEIFLDGKEKRQLRKNLVSFMRQNPRYVPDAEVQTFSLYRIFELALPRFALGVLMFVGVGAGVTFASQASVPGDFLYPFKVNVFEPAVSKLATNETSQAAWEARRAQNRLKEAARLESESKLTEQVASDLRLLFKLHLEKTQKNIDALQEKGDVDVATSIQTRLNEYMESNSAIVKRIASEKHEDSPVGAAMAKEPPSHEEGANGHSKKPSSHGHSLVETVQSILNESNSSAASEKKADDKDKDEDSNHSSSQKQGSSSSSREADASSSSVADTDDDVDADLENGIREVETEIAPLPNLLP